MRVYDALVARSIADDRLREADEHRLATLARHARPPRIHLGRRVRRLLRLAGNVRSTTTAQPMKGHAR